MKCPHCNNTKRFRAEAPKATIGTTDGKNWILLHNLGEKDLSMCSHVTCNKCSYSGDYYTFGYKAADDS